MAEPALPTAPSLGPGGRRPALLEPKPFNRDERLLWALRRGVEHASGKHITPVEAAALLIALTTPDAAFGFAAGVAGGAIHAARDYTESLVGFLRGLLKFYALVYDPVLLVPTVGVWITPPGSPERAQRLQEIAQILVKDHPEVADAIRWIPVLEIAIGEFTDWLKSGDALLDLGSVVGEGIAEYIGKEIGTLMSLATPFDKGEHLGHETGYVITSVLLDAVGF